jgi:hypothetical protein
MDEEQGIYRDEVRVMLGALAAFPCSAALEARARTA